MANISCLSSFEPSYEDYKGIVMKNGNEGQPGSFSAMLWVLRRLWWGCGGFKVVGMMVSTIES